MPQLLTLVPARVATLRTVSKLLRYAAGALVAVWIALGHARAAEGDPVTPEEQTRGFRARTLLARLTPRERDVVVAIGKGQSNAEIARILLMSLTTVKAHVSHILTKLNMANRTQIALLAHDAGLI